jgi:hypothetical protein
VLNAQIFALQDRSGLWFSAIWTAALSSDKEMANVCDFHFFIEVEIFQVPAIDAFISFVRHPVKIPFDNSAIYPSIWPYIACCRSKEIMTPIFLIAIQSFPIVAFSTRDLLKNRYGILIPIYFTWLSFIAIIFITNISILVIFRYISISNIRELFRLQSFGFEIQSVFRWCCRSFHSLSFP